MNRTEHDGRRAPPALLPTPEVRASRAVLRPSSLPVRLVELMKDAEAFLDHCTGDVVDLLRESNGLVRNFLEALAELEEQGRERRALELEKQGQDPRALEPADVVASAAGVLPADVRAWPPALLLVYEQRLEDGVRDGVAPEPVLRRELEAEIRAQYAAAYNRAERARRAEE